MAYLLERYTRLQNSRITRSDLPILTPAPPCIPGHPSRGPRQARFWLAGVEVGVGFRGLVPDSGDSVRLRRLGALRAPPPTQSIRIPKHLHDPSPGIHPFISGDIP